jgi:hypothetical protein
MFILTGGWKLARLAAEDPRRFAHKQRFDVGDRSPSIRGRGLAPHSLRWSRSRTAGSAEKAG